MKKIQILFFIFLLCLFATNMYAQEPSKVSGKILSTLNTCLLYTSDAADE